MEALLNHQMELTQHALYLVEMGLNMVLIIQSNVTILILIMEMGVHLPAK
jgi:hypothetical protein